MLHTTFRLPFGGVRRKNDMAVAVATVLQTDANTCIVRQHRAPTACDPRRHTREKASREPDFDSATRTTKSVLGSNQSLAVSRSRSLV